MRDPHVVALHYRLETGPQLAFNDPPPEAWKLGPFSVQLANGQLRVEMKDHFVTADEARLELDQYLRSWEIATALQHGPGAVRFAFEKPEVIDRDPPPPESPRITPGTGVLSINLFDAETVGLSDTAIVRIGLSRYLSPPDTFVASPDVVAVWERYEGHLAGKEPLPSMAYYCATVVQHTGAGKTINRKVLSRLRYLSTMVGTPQTLRKRMVGQELRQHTPEETAWMESVVKRIIHRVGEWTADPNAKWPQITMEDFPRLASDTHAQ